MSKKNGKSVENQNRLSYVDYWDKLTEGERKFLKQFNQEYHYGSRPKKNAIIKKTKAHMELKDEATRAHNARSSDVLSVCRKEETLTYLNENTETYEEFMKDAHDEWSWQDAYHQGGIELARKDIINRTIYDLENEHINKETTLTRFFLQMDSLRRLHQRSKK